MRARRDAARAPILDRATWGDLPEDERRLYARMMEVYAGFLAHTDDQIGRLLDFLRARGAARRHAGAAALRQRRERRGRSARLAQRAPLHARPGRRPGGAAGARRRARRPPRLQPLRVGLGVGRQHALPAVEALRLARRRAHAARRPLAEGHRRARRGARPVLPRHRPHADRARRRRHRGAGGGRRRARSSRSTARRCVRPSPTPRAAIRAGRSTSRCWAAGRSGTTAGRPRPTTSASSSPSSASGRRQPRLRAGPLGALPARRRSRRGARPRRRAPRGAAQARRLWWVEAGRNQVLPLEDGFIGRAVALEPSPWGFRGRAELAPGGGPVSRDDAAADGRRLSPGRGDRRTGRRRERRHRGARRLAQRLGVLLRRRSPGRAINLFGDAGPARRRRSPSRRAASASRSSTAAPPGGGGPHRALRRRHGRRPRQVPSTCPFRWQIGGAGLLVGRDRGFPVCDDYQPPAPFTGQIDKVVLDALLLLPRDVQAEIETLLRHE